MSRYRYRISYVWTPELAYLAGVVASDGCLSNDGRHITIVSKDAEMIANIQMILGSSYEAKPKLGGYGTWAFQLQFSNTSLYDFLTQAGITPAKSKTLGSISIPDNYYRDFLRGYFDGDGTVYGYQDTRWKNSYMYYTGFTSASPGFLIWLQSQNVKLALTSRAVIKPGPRAQTLTYAKRDSRTLFNYMYYDPHLPKLSRKYHKFIDFLDSDPYNTRDARVL